MYPQYMFRAKNMKIVNNQLKIAIFTAVKNHCILHGHVSLTATGLATHTHTCMHTHTHTHTLRALTLNVCVCRVYRADLYTRSRA